MANREGRAACLTIILAEMLMSFECGKVPVSLPYLMESLLFDIGFGGILGSAFAFAALLATLASWNVVAKIGQRLWCLVSIIIALAGSTFGAFAESGVELLISRLLEGFAFGSIVVCGPSVIAVYRAPEDRGILSGLWVAAVPAGMLLAALAANPLLPLIGWKGLWVLSIALATVTLVLSTLFLAIPGNHILIQNRRSRRTGLRSLGWTPLLLASVFFLFDIVCDSFNIFSITYLVDSLGFEYGRANLIDALGCACMIFGGFLGGILMAKARERRATLMVAVLVIVAISASVQFSLKGGYLLMLAYQCLAACMYGTIPSILYFLAPESVSSTRSEQAVALVVLGQNAGSLAGPIFIGWIIEEFGWTASSSLTGFIAFLAVATAFLFARRNRT